MRDFPGSKLGIRDFTAKSGRDSGLKVCVGGGMWDAKNSPRDYGIARNLRSGLLD